MIPVEIDIELLQDGDDAPDFSLPTHDGGTFTLSDQRGAWVVVWWYLQAMGTACASCAQAFNSNLGAIHEVNGRLVGISFASPEENAIFARVTELQFPLLTADEELAAAYGAKRSESEAWSSLPRRIAYIIDPEGVVRRRYLITGESRTAIGGIVSDLRDLAVESEEPRPEPHFGKQPHEYGAVGKTLHRVRRLVKG